MISIAFAESSCVILFYSNIGNASIRYIHLLVWVRCYLLLILRVYILQLAASFFGGQCISLLILRIIFSLLIHITTDVINRNLLALTFFATFRIRKADHIIVLVLQSTALVIICLLLCFYHIIIVYHYITFYFKFVSES